MKRYTETHEWVLIEGQIATVGVSHFGQKELGAIVFVALPELGRHLEQGEEAVVLESTKAAIDLYAPLSGHVIAINEHLQQAPETVNLEAEGQGWLYRLTLTNPMEGGPWIDEERYREQFA